MSYETNDLGPMTKATRRLAIKNAVFAPLDEKGEVAWEEYEPCVIDAIHQVKDKPGTLAFILLDKNMRKHRLDEPEETTRIIHARRYIQDMAEKRSEAEWQAKQDQNTWNKTWEYLKQETSKWPDKGAFEALKEKLGEKDEEDGE